MLNRLVASALHVEDIGFAGILPTVAKAAEGMDDNGVSGLNEPARLAFMRLAIKWMLR